MNERDNVWWDDLHEAQQKQLNPAELLSSRPINNTHCVTVNGTPGASTPFINRGSTILVTRPLPATAPTFPSTV